MPADESTKEATLLVIQEFRGLCDAVATLGGTLPQDSRSFSDYAGMALWLRRFHECLQAIAARDADMVGVRVSQHAQAMLDFADHKGANE